MPFIRRNWILLFSCLLMLTFILCRKKSPIEPAVRKQAGEPCLISGTITCGGLALSGVKVAFSHDSTDALTDSSGGYRYSVPAGVSTLLTPSLDRFSFTPETRHLTEIFTDLPNQNFSANAGAFPTFRVEGRHLYDANGEKVVLRGVNAMIIYWDKLGTVTYPEIAKTGANVVRIFWMDDPVADAVDLDGTLLTCERNRMIPMPGVWMATGKWDQLGACVDFWCRPDIAAVLKKHENTVLVNVANEAGDGGVTDAQYRAGYEDAVNRIRAAGIRSPLVIDAAGWGRGEGYILKNARYLIDRDPERNLIFSWHPWDPIGWNGTKKRIKAAIDSAVAKNIPFIIGEFSRSEQADSRSATTPIEWRTIMEYGHLNEIGWLPWVWWCCEEPNDGHSLTRDKIFGHWANAPWGEEVAVTGLYSIRNTSVRPKSMQ